MMTLQAMFFCGLVGKLLNKTFVGRWSVSEIERPFADVYLYTMKSLEYAPLVYAGIGQNQGGGIHTFLCDDHYQP